MNTHSNTDLYLLLQIIKCWQRLGGANLWSPLEPVEEQLLKDKKENVKCADFKTVHADQQEFHE